MTRIEDVEQEIAFVISIISSHGRYEETEEVCDEQKKQDLIKIKRTIQHILNNPVQFLDDMQKKEIKDWVARTYGIII